MRSKTISFEAIRPTAQRSITPGIRRIRSTAVFLILGCILSACDSERSTTKQPGSVVAVENAAPMPAPQADEIDAAAVPNTGVPIPGPRSCFWRYGPHSADPYINLAYPDSAVFYWAGVFSIPEGAKLELVGDFAHARYQSFISYDERGRPIESLADYLINPDVGSSNPFQDGNNRNSENRGYVIEIVNREPDVERQIGEYDQDSTSNLLHAPEYAGGQQVVLYRIYLPDEGKWPAGGVPLPAAKVTLADGSIAANSCDVLKTSQSLRLSADAVGIPAVTYRELITQADKPDTWPAQIPAQWFIQLDRPSLLGIYTGEIDDNARRSEGGFYPNLDNHYIRTIINRKHGKVFLVRGKMPLTPKTYRGDDYLAQGHLRYWSICSNQGFANTRVNDCLFDEEIPLDANGFYTVLVSRAADRPRNAIKKCGLAWLPMADDGDGMFDDDVTVVQIREMLASPGYENAIKRVGNQSDLTQILGPYMPRTRYMQPNQVETFFACADPDYFDESS